MSSASGGLGCAGRRLVGEGTRGRGVGTVFGRGVGDLDLVCVGDLALVGIDACAPGLGLEAEPDPAFNCTTLVNRSPNASRLSEDEVEPENPEPNLSGTGAGVGADSCFTDFTGDEGGETNLVGGSTEVGIGILGRRGVEAGLDVILPPRRVAPCVKPSLLSPFERTTGRDFVNSLISMRGFSTLTERVLLLLDDIALPGRRGATSVARGVSSESSEDEEETRGRGMGISAGLDCAEELRTWCFPLASVREVKRHVY